MRSLLLVTLVACGPSAHSVDVAVAPDGGTTNPGGSGTPLALVYRGPAACQGCPEAVASVLISSQWGFNVAFVGPDESQDVTTDVLGRAVLYAQPGGHIPLVPAYDALAGAAPVIASYVHNGGRYLGFCEGGYLAGMNPGFELLPGDSNQYIYSPGATVTNTHDTVIKVSWRGQPRYMYFQDGPIFIIDQGAPGVASIATYDNGDIAALTAPYGNGVVGVVGTYPEAPAQWYQTYGLVDPDGPDADLAHDLIDAVMQ
jgi:hypothetical protein